VEGRGYPPLAEGMQKYVVMVTTLVVMKLIEQPVAWV